MERGYPAVLEQDPRLPRAGDTGAVLLSDEIRFFCSDEIEKEHRLIDPFIEDSLKPASYDLTLGSECRLGGKPKILTKKNPYLEIPPYQVAVVSTDEVLNIPRFLIARWNLRVKYVYEGLLWVGGPQVDAGFKGRLYCPLYNLSNRHVTLRYQERVFTIDFIKTTLFNEDTCKKFEPSRGRTIMDHDIHGLTSGPFEAFRQVDDIKRRVDTFQTIVLTLIGLIFTSLAIIARIPEIGLTIQAPILMILIAAIATFLSGWLIGKN